MDIKENEPVVLEELSQDSDVTLIQKETSELDDESIPKLTVNMPQSPTEAPALISDEYYLGFMKEVVSNIKEDRAQLSGYIDTLADMVLNDGDATTSSKEALVNLLKAKTDLQDKMLKAADLMTRVKMKNAYAFSGAHLNVLQQNNIGTESSPDFSRKELIRVINQAKKKKDS